MLKFVYRLKVLAECISFPKLSLEKGLNLPESFQGPDSRRRAHSRAGLGCEWVRSPSQAGEQDQGEAGTVLTRKHPVGEHFTSKESLSGDNHMGRQHKRSGKNQKEACRPFCLSSVWKREESKPGR